MLLDTALHLFLLLLALDRLLTIILSVVAVLVVIFIIVLIVVCVVIRSVLFLDILPKLFSSCFSKL